MFDLALGIHPELGDDVAPPGALDRGRIVLAQKSIEIHPREVLEAKLEKRVVRIRPRRAGRFVEQVFDSTYTAN